MDLSETICPGYYEKPINYKYTVRLGSRYISGYVQAMNREEAVYAICNKHSITALDRFYATREIVELV